MNPEAKMPVSWLKTYPSIPFDRQIDYNALRLARTMINHSYWAANLETAKRNPFCQAMHWALSPSHFERQVAHFGEDECDTYASHDEGLGRGNFPIEELPMPHAQCLCVQYQVVPELDAVADRLGAWVDGGSDPELDKAFGEWKNYKNGLTSSPGESRIKMAPASTSLQSPQPQGPQQQAQPSQPPQQTAKQKALDEIEQQPWMQGIDAKDRKAILAQMGTFSDTEIEFWRKNAHLIQGDFYYQGGTAYYSPYFKTVNLDLSGKDAKGARIKKDSTNLITFFHETGHLFDYLSFGGTALHDQMPELDKKLREDYLNFANKLFKQQGLSTARSLSSLTATQKWALTSDLCTDPNIKSAVSDIVGGMTRKSVGGMWGHRSAYWRSTRPSVEAMAHMFEARAMKGERLDTFKKYFPSAYQYFEDTLAKF